MCDQRELYEGKSRLIEAQAELVCGLTECIRLLEDGLPLRAGASVPEYETAAKTAAYEALAATCRLVKATGAEV